MEKIRLNKYLSAQGVCSRRKADEWTEAGKILINGRPAVPGEKVDGSETIVINGKELKERRPRRVVLAFNKPAGVVCTASPKDKDNVIDFIHYPERVYPVGRLDKDSTGLLLLTNDGELMDQILKARNYHEKEYIVTVNQRVTGEFVRKMSEGVPILDTVTRPCKVRKINATTFSIILTQGLNRQIRRMCEHFGYRVLKLRRVRVMNIWLGDLPEGQWRELSEKELDRLTRMAGKKGVGYDSDR